MPMKTNLLLLLAFLTSCTTTATTVRADQPRQHPAYLHALEDLRHARAHLERPATVTAPTAWDERVAVSHIDAAMREITQAAIDDGKNLADHPPVDVALDWPGRLRRTLELLRRARADVNQEEDNQFARGLKRRAIEHIDAAIGFVEQGIASNERLPPPPPAPPPAPPPPPPPGPGPGEQPGRHPAYLHALEDLRHARAHLERPAHATRRTRWDERVAIEKIDAAIREIREAAIDDGKNLADHPPVDARLDWPGRLHRALELLRRARADVNEREDNAFGRGLKRRALAHMDQAIHFVEQGIADNR
jgi:hypothetical protein